MPDRSRPDAPKDPKVVRPRLRAPGAGRPRKSAKIHRLDGTRIRNPAKGKPLGEAAVVDAEIPPALLDPPHWMHKFAKVFWRSNAPALARCGRLTLSDLSSWAALCGRYAEYERNERELIREPLRSKERPQLAAAARQAYQQYSVGCLRFGLDPATRIRLNTLDGADPGSSVPAQQSAGERPAVDPAEDWHRRHGDGG